MINRKVAVIGFVPLAAVASLAVGSHLTFGAAPAPTVSLEQVGPNILVRWSNTAPDQTYMEISESGSSTNWVGSYRAFSYSFPVRGERLHTFTVRSCDASVPTRICSPAVTEQIFAVVPRANRMPTSGILNWRLAQEVPYYPPAPSPWNNISVAFNPEAGLCKENLTQILAKPDPARRTGNGCVAFARDTTDGLNSYRIVTVGAQGLGLIDPYNAEKRFYKMVNEFYGANKNYSDTHFFEYMLYGYIGAATVKPMANGNEYFMQLKPYAEGWGNSIDTVLWANKFIDNILNGRWSNRNLWKYRWTLYSVSKMLINSLYQDYNFNMSVSPNPNGGVFVPYEANSGLTRPWRNGYFLSFAGVDYRGDPKMSLGKFMETLEYLRIGAGNMGTADFISNMPGIPVGERANSILNNLMIPGLQRLGAEPKASNVTISQFYNPVQKYGDYHYNFRTESREGIAFSMNRIKSCGDFRYRVGGIGQVKHMYEILFGNLPDIRQDSQVYAAYRSPAESRIEGAIYLDSPASEKGYGYSICKGACDTQLERIKEHYYMWKIGCCEAYANEDWEGMIASDSGLAAKVNAGTLPRYSNDGGTPGYCKANMGQYNRFTGVLTPCSMKLVSGKWVCAP